MEEKKNNKGIIWLIIILLVLVLGLIGCIIYDKVLKIDKTNNDNTTTTTTTQMNDDDIIIKEKTINGENYKVTLKFQDYETGWILKINDENHNLIEDKYYSYNPNPKIELYENFIALIRIDEIDYFDDLVIFDYSGNKLFDSQENFMDEIIFENENLKEFSNTYIPYAFEISENKIKYKVEYRLVSCQFNYLDHCENNYLNCNDLEELGNLINDNADYEINFNGKSFEKPKLISSTKLKDNEYFKKALETCN